MSKPLSDSLLVHAECEGFKNLCDAYRSQANEILKLRMMLVTAGGMLRLWDVDIAWIDDALKELDDE